jgi:RNA polymerase sigma-70 factor (ECF subfamily)
LLVRVQARDPRAWERFVALYTPLVYHWCRGEGLAPADAVDVGQEVFCAVALAIAAFQYEHDRGTFRGWLRRITENEARDFLRRTEDQPRGAGGSDALKELLRVPAPADDGGEQLGARGEGRLLYGRALEMVRAEFPEGYWAAFWRVAIEGHRPADVAADLALSVNVVYLARSRILARLREEFAGLIDFDKVEGPPGISPRRGDAPTEQVSDAGT